MALTPTVQTSQGDIGLVLDSGSNTLASQADVTAVFNFSAERLDVSAAEFATVSLTTTNIDASQADLIVVCLGRREDPTIRVWTFTLDGHDFYVLRLGNNETLVYDLLTEQWSIWASASEFYWSIFTGANWFGGNTFAAGFGSNVIVGSDSNGSLFFLDPTKTEDDALIEGRDPSTFRRQVTGQIPVRGYDSVSVHEVQILGSINELSFGASDTVELLYSDDRGDTYVSAGVLTTVDGDYDLRGHWQSLGTLSSPGRLFRIEDFGALQRIDSLTVITNKDEK